MSTNPYREGPSILETENEVLKQRLELLDAGFKKLQEDYKKLLKENLELAKRTTVVPSAAITLPDKPEIQKWEYMLIQHAGVAMNKTRESFDAMGEHGWELVNSTDAHAFFKRRIWHK